MSDCPRRKTLRIAGAVLGVTAVGGCLSEPSSGSLVVDNDHDKKHTVTVTVTKTSRDSDDTGYLGETPAPDTTPVWQRSAEFTVGAGERTLKDDFVDEPGAFYFDAELDTGERGDG